jgi:hypothetical protein
MGIGLLYFYCLTFRKDVTDSSFSRPPSQMGIFVDFALDLSNLFRFQ